MVHFSGETAFDEVSNVSYRTKSLQAKQTEEIMQGIVALRRKPASGRLSLV